ncbi:ABC transporter substrate-binding protein [Arthrobacter rhombi]|uniref:ABC transporter substrate-binding protein n=1 Tax=Micrococcaceae TaxID=1268 RepID=UPI000BB7B2A8|nr:iron-siderophore ABC transporter substrate-binding protein [Glutamicibacter sp. BW78]PCC24667.1 ABC transporter substrate-binding protein [Glutamicibacter sp. BW78]
MKLLRPLLILTTATLLLTGCGTTEEPSGSTADGQAPAESTGPVTLTDTRGKKIELDAPATRVVGTEWVVVEDLVALGVMPVGAADVKGYTDWVKAEPLDDTVTDIGTRGEPSFETVASLDADLIVATTDLPEKVIAQLEDLAPVFVITPADATRQIDQATENLDLIAQATGTEEAAAATIDDYEKAVAAGRDTLADAGLDGARVAFTDGWVADGQVSLRPYPAGSLLTDINTELGLEAPWTLEGDPAYGLATTDVEALTKLKTDYFVYIGSPVDGDFTDALKDNAVWTSLPFVQDGNVERLDDGIWMFGGPSSMTQYVKSLVSTLTAS